MSFEDNSTWQSARELLNAAYRLNQSPSLAQEAHLAHRLQDAALAVMAAIADGYERLPLEEKLDCFNAARADLVQVRTLLYAVADNFPDAAAQVPDLREKATKTGRLLSALVHTTERKMAHLPPGPI